MVDRARAVAAATVLHPDHTRTAATATVHANLALLFSVAELPADAWPHFEALGDTPVEGMWSYYNGTEKMYRTKRDAAAKAAAKNAGTRAGVRA